MRFSFTKREANRTSTAMVFPSVPSYLDSSHWHHQQISNHIVGSNDSNPSVLPPHAPPPQQQPHGGPGSGSIRPGSMSERARQANIPMPEPAQRCPRCDSTNTKFCYFNNYSLTQPRHFCKTCRRYWTRGGALRSVPVGGGCRRNKRSTKATSSSSSPASSEANRRPQQTNPSSTCSSVSNITVPYSYGGGAGGLSSLGQQFQPLRFMSPLSQLSEGFNGDMMSMSSYGGQSNVPAASDYHGSSNQFLGFEQWKLQQFPFLGGLDPSPGAYEFHGDGQKVSSSLFSQLGSVKMEESKNPAGLSLMSRELSGDQMQGNHEDHHWNINMNGNGGGGGTAAAANWAQLSSFASCSTSNRLQ